VRVYVDALTLSPVTYQVYRRVPSLWWNETEIRTEIAAALNLSIANVARRLAPLVHNGLVERRRREALAPFYEIRRVKR